ncbi:MAG: PqiC family protein [Mariprofundales bacterium]|nr:PqiC family protein [Mariprofundales bacterium]
MRWFPLWIVFMLTACSTTPTRYYVLTAAAPSQASPAIVAHPKISIEVSQLELPKYLDRPQIVSHLKNNQLEISDYAQWGGRLRNNMMRLLATNLSRALGTSQIIIAPYRPNEPATVRLMIEVIRFERMSDGIVHLDAQWRLIDGATDRSLITRITRLQSTKKVSDVADTVTEMSQLFARFSDTIADEIAARAK